LLLAASIGRIYDFTVIAKPLEDGHVAATPAETDYLFRISVRRRSQRLRAAADKAKDVREREKLLRKARQAETAAHVKEWITSPGLQPPT